MRHTLFACFLICFAVFLLLLVGVSAGNFTNHNLKQKARYDIIKTVPVYARKMSGKMPQNTCKARNINTFKRVQNMTKILFVCHGSILKNPGKAHKINDCTAQ